LDEEKSKHPGLAQENSFGSAALLCSLRRVVKGAATLCTCRKECHEYDLISVSDWPTIMIGPGGLLLP